eukprot:SAG25_NODE_4430_length_816_cov_0.889819_2_plen_98_part_01
MRLCDGSGASLTRLSCALGRRVLGARAVAARAVQAAAVVQAVAVVPSAVAAALLGLLLLAVAKDWQAQRALVPRQPAGACRGWQQASPPSQSLAPCSP